MSTKGKILIIDDEESMRDMVSKILRRENFYTKGCENGLEAIKLLEKEEFDAILCDVRMSKMDGIEFLKEAKKRDYDAIIIMMSAYGSIDSAVKAMKLGAYDYISKPFKPDEILLTLEKGLEHKKLKKENIELKERLKGGYIFENIVGKSQKIISLFKTIDRVAKYDSTVLIVGESGTGKELVAKAIHNKSERKKGPFIAVNCGAIPHDLLESELFGHMAGAFTDAKKDKAGLFEEAEHGTLFLDEIGELPSPLQVKLLRVLQDGEVRRIGENISRKVSVRVIAATARDLAKEVEQNKFRSDLFYRLNVLPICIPPLRERKEDIPLLIDHFIQKINQRLNLKINGIEKETLKYLIEYEWPGNIRELENCIERMMIMTDNKWLSTSDIPQEIMLKIKPSKQLIPDEVISIKKASKMIEEELIKKALKKTGNNHSQAARLLEISYKSLLTKIKEYGIE